MTSEDNGICLTCERARRATRYWVTNIPQSDSVWRWRGGLQNPTETWYMCGLYNQMTQMEVDAMNREYAKKYTILPPIIEKNPMRGEL